jgi:Domain of unknown function (DUF5916)/Carbohydrate family 9 binding domain-like
MRYLFVPAILLLALAGDLAAQEVRPPDDRAEAAASSPAGAAGPLAPEVFAQDGAGQITLRATRLAAPLTIDGALDEAAYREVKAITHFIQMEPRQGEPATERTEAWLFFDDRNFYVSVRSYDSAPDRLVANEMRRDSFNVFQNDNITVSIDSLYTRRSGYFFQTNALGALRDQEVFDERSNNQDWNTVWYTRSQIVADGWTTEIAIPFKSLRFRAAGPQVWGFNLRRLIRWKNEQHSIAPIPASAGNRAMYRFDIFATLVGVETPAQARNLEVKPYAIGAVTTNRAVTPRVDDDLSANAGGDVKYGLTRSLVADLTVRTDFAQVEEDQQQINLTRFSLFFPEKREFFLEGQGLFNFGSGQRGGDGSSGPSLTPVVFYSRRIGLSDTAQSVPIEVGGRISGRAGPYSIGLLNIQTDDSRSASAPSTNFSVVRLRRDVLRRSNVGLIATHRAPDGGPTNSVVGVDANLAFFQNVIAQGFWTLSETQDSVGPVAERSSYRGEFEYNGDRYGARVEHLTVGAGYDPQIGFLRREAFSREYGYLRFSPRPRQSSRIRKHYYEGEFDYITGSDGVLETQEARATYRVELQNNDQWRLEYAHLYELLRQPFAVVPGVVIPAGGYWFDDVRSEYQFGPQRRVSGTVTAAYGGFYDGTRSEAGYRGLVVLSPRLTLEPGITINWLDLPTGRATTHLITNRTNLTLSPRMALAVNIQYNSTTSSVGSSVRYRWEYQPGSDLFVVYSDGRDTTDRRGFPALVNRTLVVKATRLWRF